MSEKKLTGKGPILIDTSVVLDMASWSVDITNELETQAELETGAQSTDYGLQSFSGSAEGVSALEDTTGQDLVRDASVNKVKIKNIKFYERYSVTEGDKVAYWQPKPTSNGIVISQFGSKKDGGSSTTKISFSFTNDGEMERKVDTL